MTWADGPICWYCGGWPDGVCCDLPLCGRCGEQHWREEHGREEESCGLAAGLLLVLGALYALRELSR